MHNRRFSPTPNQTHSNHNKGASVGENVDVNVAGGNFTKHHQFLFPSHLYKRLFDTTTAIFPKAPPTTSTMNVDNKNTTAPEASVIPKNLLFSCAADDVGKSDDEERNKENEEVRFSLFSILFFSLFVGIDFDIIHVEIEWNVVRGVGWWMMENTLPLLSAEIDHHKFSILENTSSFMEL